MAIGTAAAIGLGVAGIGSAIGASSNRSAANRAADVSQENTDANIALTRDIYGQNRAMLDPFVQRGNAAGNQINALLGLPTGQAAAAQPAATQPNTTANALQAGGFMPDQFMTGERMAGPRAFTRGAGLPYGLGDNFITTGSFANGSFNDNPQTGLQTPGYQAASAQDSANSAFDTFRNSTGYQFRLGEGLDAVSSAYAGIGGMQSGAAMRGIQDYAQDFASNEFGNYMNALGLQQSVGAGAASSAAGVGQNFAANVANINTNNANNQANALLTRGNNNVFGNLASTIGGGILGFGL